jgi:PIN like domain
MRFFFDRNMSRYLAQAIDKLDRENEIRQHDDHPRFNIKTADVEWIATLAEDSLWSVTAAGPGRTPSCGAM